MKHVLKLWCEWDIGLGDVVYQSEDTAWEEARQALKDCGVDEPLEELRDEGLIGIDTLEVR